MKEIQMSLLPLTITPTPLQSHAQEHVEVGAFLKSFIYGGIDGTINILTIILSASAIDLSNALLVTVSLAATLGDAISMGLGDYISYKSEQDYVLSEREREQYEFEHMREEQLEEMELLLQNLSFSPQDSQRLTKLYSSNSKVFIDLMMMTELGLVASKVAAWQIGLVNFFSFLFAGSIPLLPYMLVMHKQQSMLFWSGLLGAFQLFALGYIKGIIIRGDYQTKKKLGYEVLILGGAVTIIGACIGSFFGQ